MSASVNSALTLTPYTLEYQEHIKLLLEVDKTRNCDLIHDHIAIRIVKAKVNLSLREIESIFRRFEAYTYLIARILRDEDLYCIIGEELKYYQLFMSTRNKELALQEITEESKDYEENFEKLGDTGLTFSKTEETAHKYFKMGRLTIV